MAKMKWTHPSVVAFAKKADPVEEILRATREVVLKAIEDGWNGPPFDPFELASHLELRVVPSQEVRDAMLVPDGRRFRLEFNPDQPRRRIRFSIAHEIAHTLFPDCKDQVRHRVRREAMRDDEWQLEMLCNIAASELLMPAGELPIGSQARLGIDELIELRDQFDVSLETILLRVVRLERRNCFVFVASFCPSSGRYRIDYAVETNGAGFGVASGLALPRDSRLERCAAIGFTSKSDETWVEGQPLHVECVGIPPYPGQTSPRVAGIAYRKGERGISNPRITFLTGDATSPQGPGNKIIAHVVNDGAARWGGGGFANAVRRKWPAVQADFVDWAQRYPRSFRLGETHQCQVDEGVTILHMICQRGYQPSTKPLIRYQHLRTCLCVLRDLALSQGATVHMPRIGCGLAGGNWAIVQDLILECLSDYGVDVTVYDLPSRKKSAPRAEQRSLFATF